MRNDKLGYFVVYVWQVLKIIAMAMILPAVLLAMLWLQSLADVEAKPPVPYIEGIDLKVYDREPLEFKSADEIFPKPAPEPAPKPAPKLAEKPASKTFTITFYCPCKKCCGKSNGITASGTKAKAGRTIAAPKNYKFGTKLKVEGLGTFTVEDRGGSIKGNRLDVFVDSHEEALRLGVQGRKVEVVK